MRVDSFATLFRTPLAMIAILAFISVSLPLTTTYFFLQSVSPRSWIWALTMPVFVIAVLLCLPRKPLVRLDALFKAQPVLVVPVLIPLSLGFQMGYMLVFLQIAILFINSLIAISLLLRYRDNPAFYAWTAVGVLVGGLATLLFREYTIAYPLIMLSLYAWWPTSDTAPAQKTILPAWAEMAGYPLALALGLALLRLVEPTIFYLRDVIPLLGGILPTLYIAGYTLGAVGAVYYFRYSLPQFILGLLAILAVGVLFPAGTRDFGIDPTLLVAVGALVYILTMKTNVVFHKKTRFGDIRVIRRPQFGLYVLMNDDTYHSLQYYTPEKRHEPVSYYHPESPFGQLYRYLPQQMTRPTIGVVGLGAGTIAAYAKAGQHWTFFEINPVVAELAQSGEFFTYLKDAPATIEVVVDDVLAALPNKPDRYFDLLVLDAFNDDKVPLNLLTKESLHLYLQKIKDNGLLILHVSSKQLQLYAIVAKIAETLGLSGAIQYRNASVKQDVPAHGLGLPKTATQQAIGEDILVRLAQAVKKMVASTGIFMVQSPEASVENEAEYSTSASEWVVLTRDPADLAPLWQDARWQPLKSRKNDPILQISNVDNPLVISEFLRD